MDNWKFFDITHREHIICNPTSIKKLEELVALVRLRPDAHVLEIATGKGEFIIRLAERYSIEGVGVDLSPYFIADAKRKHQKRVPDARLTFLEMDGADYEPEKPESFDLVACIGASWIYGGHRGTLKALRGMAAQESWIVVGEPYWRQEPEGEYLEAIGEERNRYGTHNENVEVGQELGLEIQPPNYQKILVFAKQVWAIDADSSEIPHRFIFGVQFEYISREDADFLGEVVDAYREQNN